MINAEKYRKEILNNYSKGFSIIDGHIDDCESIACESCLFGHSKNDDGYLTCINRKVKWLLSEYKEPVKLTRLEYEILKLAINKSCEYIARDSDGQLFVFMEKPHKGESFWKTDGYYYLLEMFSVLFQFVKWEDSTPTLIKDVLENCEVVEDAEE